MDACNSRTTSRCVVLQLPLSSAHVHELQRRPFDAVGLHMALSKGHIVPLPQPDGNDHTPPAAPRKRRSSTFTSTPDTPAPELLCPTCDSPLLYKETVISGVKPIERWDYFECRACGPFVYRDRTRKLRPAS
jgi:hypothetical protein